MRNLNPGIDFIGKCPPYMRGYQEIILSICWKKMIRTLTQFSPRKSTPERPRDLRGQKDRHLVQKVDQLFDEFGRNIFCPIFLVALTSR